MASPSGSRSTSPTRASSTATMTIPQRYAIVPSPTIVLPTSYADAVLLHVLATKPDAVIPPGKTLRSVLIRPDPKTTQDTTADQQESLQSTVEKIVHRAFWDEARESLSSSEPSRQIARLRLLYNDLHAVLEGLLPKSHKSYVTLADPLSPTPAPLLSTRRHLIELTSALLERCAPVRDAQLNSIRSLLESEDPSDLPDRIIRAIKQLLEIAEVMKKDLSSAVLGAVSDDDLEREVVRVARVEERRAILEIYGAKGVRERWKAWLANEEADEAHDEYTWVRRLVQALGADVAISCPLPVPEAVQAGPSSNESQANINAVPPVFALSSAGLFHLQNHIQALVIAAVLRTLVPLHIASTTSARLVDGQGEDAPESRTFADRVLALLMIEVDENSEDAGTTKLVNLADEVLREHRRLQSITPSAPPDNLSEVNHPPSIDEKTIRSRVDALLKPTNPVFILLRKRLLTTLTDSLISALRIDNQERAAGKGRHATVVMQTGRDLEREPKRPRLNLPEPSTGSDSHEKGQLRRIAETLTRAGKVHTKGYEDPVLVRGTGDVLLELAVVVEWVRDTWAGHGLGLDGLGFDQSASDGDRSLGRVEERTAADGQDEDSETA